MTQTRNKCCWKRRECNLNFHSFCSIFMFFICILNFTYIYHHIKWRFQVFQHFSTKFSQIGVNKFNRSVTEVQETEINGHGLPKIQEIYQNVSDKFVAYDSNFKDQMLRNTPGLLKTTENMGQQVQHSYTSYKAVYHFRRSKTTSVDCGKLIKGDYSELKNKTTVNSKLIREDNHIFQNISNNCERFKRKRHYITSSLTKEEEMFPIAYSLVVFKEAFQVERLLRAIYRPQNIYCVHVDKKSQMKFKDIISNISSCFDNVFIAKKSVDVIWGTFSVLEPELTCMSELLKYKKWKYFINLTGQEFPLRTNYELVKILKIYHGANDMEGTVKRANKERWAHSGNPPYGIRPVKGSIHITVNRDFVNYVIHNQTARDFLKWAKTVDVPDEVYFSSLNHNPHLMIPGSYKGEPETNWKTKPFLTRFKNWVNDWPCHGKRVRLICVFGAGDLPLLSKRPELFANKFYADFEPLALDCLEELHYNRTREEYHNKFVFNTSFYEQLEFIKNVVV